MFAPRNSRPSEFRKKSPQTRDPLLQNASKKIPKKVITKLQRSPNTVEPLPTPVSVAPVHETTTVAEALGSCVLKREDFILVMGENEALVGIITSTDIIYRSLAYNLDFRTTTVSRIMTPHPIVGEETTTSSDALEMMISNNIYHLPICDSDGKAVHLLHLKDTFQEYLDSIRLKFEASERLYRGMSAAGIELCKELGSDKSHATHMLAAAEKLLNKIAMPDFATIVALQGQTVVVKSTESINKVVRIMKAKETSAVCVMEDIDYDQDNASSKALGLCTSWDIALYIAGSGLGALQSSVINVTNTSTMRVRPSMGTSEVARTMLKDHLSNILVIGTVDRTPAIVNMLSIASTIYHQLQPAIRIDSPSDTQTSLDVAPSTFVNSRLSTVNGSEDLRIPLMNGNGDNTDNTIPNTRETATQQDTDRASYMGTVGRLKASPWPTLITENTSDPHLVRIYDKSRDNTTTPISHVRKATAQHDVNRASYMATVGRLKTSPRSTLVTNDNTSDPQFVRTWGKFDSPVVSASPRSEDVTSERNHDRGRVVAVVSRTGDTKQTGPLVRMENSDRARIMALVGRMNYLSRSSNEAPPGYHANPEVEADALTMALRKHHNVFRCYLPLPYLSEAYTIRSTIRLKLTALGGQQLYELSSDIFEELATRRLQIWTGGDISCTGFSFERNQFRLRLSEEPLSHFQDLVGDVYFELCRRYPTLQEDVYKSRDMMVMSVVARLTEIFQDVSLYRHLLSLRESKAQRLLDLFQYFLDSPDLLPQFRRNLLVATQRLSSMSGLCPTCYELEDIELLGNDPVTSGGFADIYKGYLGGQTVCLKVIRLYQTSDVQSFIKRASAEAILWSQLQHPNLLPFYGLYRFNSRICLVSPWMDQVIKIFLDNNPDVNRRLLVFDVVSGVAFLHAHDIVHGDLKGANILVNKLQRATIADFGLSSVSDPNILHWASHSTAESKGGSVRWQAPELFDVVNDELVHNSKATDIYALACVAYEIFTGELPFFELGKLEATIMFRIKAGDRPSRPQLSSPGWQPMRLTTSLWTLMESCWVTRPQERPNIQEIAAHGDFRVPDTRAALDADMIFPPHSRYSITSSSAVLPHDTLQNLLKDLNQSKDEA